ncbi:hypothetical protein ACTQ1O_12835 [Bilifractor sp. LCP21S3_A7]|uniref:hypothetical protein n=1 Tax=Bilifractor sp. LCP21S3_A7 TaxID=3438738 RepID=UPI003F8E723A
MSRITDLGGRTKDRVSRNTGRVSRITDLGGKTTERAGRIKDQARRYLEEGA